MVCGVLLVVCGVCLSLCLWPASFSVCFAPVCPCLCLRFCLPLPRRLRELRTEARQTSKRLRQELKAQQQKRRRVLKAAAGLSAEDLRSALLQAEALGGNSAGQAALSL
jgi:hypothetical protein